MTNLKSKENLLNSQINKLGLGGNFNNHFFRNFKNSRVKMEQKDVLTLSEFISLNPDIKNNDDWLLTSKNSDWAIHGFGKNSKCFLLIRSLLLENGFTYKDWLALLPDFEAPDGKFYLNFDLLKNIDKSILLKLSIDKITGIKASSTPFINIKLYFLKKKGFTEDERGEWSRIPVLVEDILTITDIEALARRHWLKNDNNNTLALIQKKLKEYGFSKENGPFMTLDIPITESTKKRLGL